MLSWRDFRISNVVVIARRKEERATCKRRENRERRTDQSVRDRAIMEAHCLIVGQWPARSSHAPQRCKEKNFGIDPPAAMYVGDRCQAPQGLVTHGCYGTAGYARFSHFDKFPDAVATSVM